MRTNAGGARRPWPAAGLLLGLCFLGQTACLTPSSEVKLTPDEEEFLSRVRYIITVRERKAFLRTPSSERAKFVEAFWAGRDPDPTTEENEFREEYLGRLEEADRLFSGEGRPGWLTDRGRVFILLGPPDQRATYKGGYLADSLRIVRDTIIWYYRGIPLVFVDARGMGEFELDMSDLDRLEALRILLAGRPGTASPPGQGSGLLDVSHALRREPNGFRTLVLSIPYKRLWFNVRDDVMETNLALRLTIVDAAGKTVARDARDIPVSLTEKQLLSLRDGSHAVEIPLLLDAGTYNVRVTVQNKVSGDELKKTFTLVIPR
jgi:GWxTD domain-containing protein